jgi:hypothetical protein
VPLKSDLDVQQTHHWPKCFDIGQQNATVLVRRVNYPYGSFRHHEIKHNDTQHNDILHNDIEHKGLICDTHYSVLLCLVSLCLVSRFIHYYAECRYAHCRYAECRCTFVYAVVKIALI